jgi:hypothetical protein
MFLTAVTLNPADMAGIFMRRLRAAMIVNARSGYKAAAV